MKLKHLDHYFEFFDAVQTCEGEVYFCTCEGDRLNLKSTLSQFLFASVCKDRDYLEAGDVEYMLPHDYERLGSYLCTG